MAIGLLSISWAIGVPARAAEPDEPVAFRNVRVFDGSRVIPSATVVVAHGVIDQVGPGAEVPEGARVIDGTGKTLVPGLIDCHTHTLEEVHLRQMAVLGVTTALDMASDPAFAARMRSDQKAGKAHGRADLFSAGPAVVAVAAAGMPSLRQVPPGAAPDKIQEFVDALIAEGSDYIKVMCGGRQQVGLPEDGPTIGRETVAAIARAAHARGKLVVAHVLELEAARMAVAGGVDGLVHLFIDAPADDSFLALAAERAPFVVPTMTALETIMGYSGGAALADDIDMVPYLIAEEARYLKLPGSRHRVPADRRAIPGQTVRKLENARVPILAGTDAPSSGVAHGASLHQELELLVASGLSPGEALAAATSRPAQAFGLRDRGRIAPGFRADVVLVDGDPTADIRATRKIAGVWKQGQSIARDTWRDRIRAEAGGIASAHGDTPPPTGAEPGLVSDFEQAGAVRAGFGRWVLSTDSFLGGKSTATFEVTEGGANGSKGALLIRGHVADRPQPRFAGVRFLPGRTMFEAANLSARKALSFRARGDGKTYSAMLFTRKGGFTPSVKSFVAGQDWTLHRFELKEFGGSDGSDVTGIFLGAGPETGAFELRIDDVRLD